MEVKFQKDQSKLTVDILGRLDTNTAPELESEIENIFEDDLQELIFDFANLEYVSSAGLRVILAVSKKTKAKGIAFKIKNANEEIIEVFEITGFLDILNVE